MATLQRQWTPADVRELMDESRAWPRYELIGGELVVTPAPGGRHQLHVGELFYALTSYLDTQRIGVAFVSPADLELITPSIVQPDVFVVPRVSGPPAIPDAERWENVKSLLVAVEVLSPSTTRSDRVVKREYYLEADVPEYWIVDPEALVIERWTPQHSRPELIRDRLAWHPDGASQAFILDVPRFFARVAERAREAGIR